MKSLRRSVLPLFTALALLLGQLVAIEHGIDHAVQVVEHCDKHFACSQVFVGIGGGTIAFAIPEVVAGFEPAFHPSESAQSERLAFRSRAPPVTHS